MRKRVLFAAAFLSASILAGCSASSPAQTGSEAAVSSVVSQTVSSLDDSVYTNAEKTFQFTVPQGWKEESSKTTKDRVLFVSPGGDRALELKRQQPDANLLAYSKSDFVAEYSNRLLGFTLLDMRTVTSDGHKGVSLTYTCRQKNQDYTVVQCIFGGDYDYNITYSAVKGGTDFIEDARKSFQSFRALSPEREPSKLMGRLNGRVYTAKDGAYKMTLPKGWKLSKETKNLLLFTSKDGRVNINLQTSKSDPRLLQYKKAYFTEYFRSTLGESAKVTSFRKTSVSGKTARYLECTYTRYGQPLRAKQYLFNDGETGYVLTFTAPAAMKKVANFGEVARSFEILEQ